MKPKETKVISCPKEVEAYNDTRFGEGRGVRLKYDDGDVVVTLSCIYAIQAFLVRTAVHSADEHLPEVHGFKNYTSNPCPSLVEERKGWAAAIGLSFKDIEDNNLDVYFDFDKQALYIRDIGKNSIGPISFSTRRAKAYTSEFLAQYSSKQTAVEGCIAHYLITNKAGPTQTITMTNGSSITLAPGEGEPFEGMPEWDGSQVSKETFVPKSVDAIIEKFGPDVHIEPGQDEDGKINGRYL